MLKGIFELGEEACLVAELGGLQSYERTPQRLFGPIGDRLEDGEGHLCADDGGGLKECLVLQR